MWAFAFGVIAIFRVVSSQNASVPVLGVQTGIDSDSGARPPRLNVNDLYLRGGPQWYVAPEASRQTDDEGANFA